MTLSNCLKFGLSDAKLYMYPDFIQIMVCLLQVNIDTQLTNNMYSRVVLKMSPSYISIQRHFSVTLGILPNELWVCQLFHSENINS